MYPPITLLSYISSLYHRNIYSKDTFFQRNNFPPFFLSLSLSRNNSISFEFPFPVGKSKECVEEERNEIRRGACSVIQRKGYVSERAIYPRTKTSRATLQLRREGSCYMTHRIRVIQMEGLTQTCLESKLGTTICNIDSCPLPFSLLPVFSSLCVPVGWQQ